MRKSALLYFIPLFVLAITFCSLSIKDYTAGIFVMDDDTALKIYVTDLDGNAISGATVCVVGQKSAVTNYTGFCPAIPVAFNSKEKEDWFTVTVTVRCVGYVNTAVVSCVIYKNKTRTLQVRLMYDDGTLPYAVYTETPPEEYIKGLFE